MDVCLHYRSDQDKSSELFLITERSLQDFPTRVLPVFTPWFPSSADQLLPIKPKKSPPVISWNQVQSSECTSQRSESAYPTSASANGEEKSVESSKRKVISNPEAADDDWQVKTENVAKKYKRSWCVIPQKTKIPDSTHSISRHFHKIIQRHGLHLHQRAKLIICELNCAPLSIEEVWSRISQAIKHARLPTCNANYQRNVSQIWVYCDIFCCEYIGTVLRQHFQLSGNITLAVHKLGDIFML
ncbi:shieldin complex subunit 3 [Trichomycterus rosablanca]|uniref:shieldin complex subunit 3 n=1 Tax=Trichomycterus rosablanca TaxID=2290929 RepID=UPI002F352BF9